MGGAGLLHPPDGAEVGRGQDRHAVAMGDRGRCSVGRSSSDRRGDLVLAQPQRRGAQQTVVAARLDDRARRSSSQRIRRRAAAPAQEQSRLASHRRARSWCEAATIATSPAPLCAAAVGQRGSRGAPALVAARTRREVTARGPGESRKSPISRLDALSAQRWFCDAGRWRTQGPASVAGRIPFVGCSSAGLSVHRRSPALSALDEPVHGTGERDGVDVPGVVLTEG